MSDSTKVQPEAVALVADAQPIKENTPVNPIKEEDAPVDNTDNTNMQTDATAEKSTEEAKTEVKPDTKAEVKSETTTRGNKTNNAKSDPKILPKTDDPEKIRKQVEYYFGDANLSTDKFMWESTGGPENKAVPLKVLCKFGRMHRFEPYSAIVAALKESEVVDITGPDGEEVISRKIPYKLDPDGPKKRFNRSVYIKGFGEEGIATQFEIEDWIEQYGTVDRVKLRREDDNTFKGSVFAEFSTEEGAQKFVALDPAPKFQDKDLVIMTKQAYTDMKIEQIKNGEIEPSKSKPASFYEGRIKGGRGGHNKGSKQKENGKEGRENGFRGGRGGRGGRGRGRGGRGGRGRGGRGGRDDRSNGRAAAAEKSATPRSVNGVKEPEIKVTTEKTSSKRAREEDSGDKAPPPKKLDTKAE